MLNIIKKPLVLLVILVLAVAGFGFVVKSLVNVNNEVVSINSRLDTLRGSDSLLVGASALFAQNASVQLNLEVLGTYASTSGNFSFNGEIMPDGATCSNNQILKRTGANDWDCAADATGSVASNSLNFDEFQNPLVADANITFTGGQYAFTFDHASVSSNFEVGGNASLSTGFIGNYIDFNAISNPTAPAAGIARFHSATMQGFTRFEQDNESTTNLVLGRDNVFIGKNTSGSDMTKGQAVYVTGSTGNVPNISLAKADSINTLPAIGVLLDNISNNAFGQIMKLGIISSFDTSAFSTGDRIFISATTAGGLANTRPAYPNYVQRVGSVLVDGVGNGSLSISMAPFIGMEETGTNSSTFTFAGSASISTNFEAIGYASASLFQGTAFGGIDCNDATDKLLWSGGLFTCGTLAVADVSATGGTGIDINTNDFVFDATELEALTWGAGGNASNVWTFNLSAGDPTMTWTQSGASLSLNFEAIGYASASSYFGTAFGGIDCNDNAEGLQWSGGAFTCRAWADADIPDAITINGGTIGSNNISSGVTWTTTGQLTIGDNGDAVNFDTSTWDISSGVFSGVAGMTGTGDWDLGGAELEVSNGTSFTFDTIGELFFDTTDFQFQIASASANTPRVIPTMQKFWSASIASTSNEFFNGGSLPLPTQRKGFRIKEIHCGIGGGTSVVINVANRNGNNNTETLTCTPTGVSDTDITTNNNYTSFTNASASLEFGAITGTLDAIDYLDFSIWGVIAPQ